MWAEMVDTLTDAKGLPLLVNEIDGRSQQRWLATRGRFDRWATNFDEVNRQKAEARRVQAAVRFSGVRR
ncbi:hypothetical protein NSK11_contig00048-0009 [Nocardia seriolae]|uniref:Uncharacterized protein n=1 Tax=Nocardia seriolae TaxID=37332 RepID=A0ABC9YU57_9NOCA|nr:hypothetical protein NS14008_15830 [Nocardia seriolae]PSK31311.1 hypothetical protein C6575_11115 [Nocardia seriolae]RLP31891.1 hypothetical protein D6158_10700 [Nocardia seriolae]BAW07538.1 conserved hypothetical protein [Nocardia seriolae]GAM47130.1 hypothetical protein NS07_v2contig00044-0008 [Nocardia seriolae]